MRFNYGTMVLRGFLASCIFVIPVSASTRVELTIGGVECVSMTTVARSFGMDKVWTKRGERMTLSSRWTRLELTADQRDIRLNGIRVFLGRSVASTRGDFYISRIDFERTLRAILTPQVFGSVPKLHRIVIDPGHGGKDPGTTNRGLAIKEKDFVLDISQRLRALLQGRGYDVVLTRDKDEYIALSDRPAVANRVGADLFISVHLNAVDSKSVHGTETYSFTPQHQSSTSSSKLRIADRKAYPGNRFDPWNILTAYYIHRDMVQTLSSSDRGLKRGRMAVLKTLSCPGVLVEAGFVTHSEEGQLLRSRAYRQKIAHGIAEGVSRYQKTINRLRGMSANEMSPDGFRDSVKVAARPKRDS